MPCRSDYMEPTGREISAATQAELDRLTRENDRLREDLIKLGDNELLELEEWRWIRGSQTEHRKEDLARLEKTLRAAIADQKALGREGGTDLHTKLGLVLTADVNKPLEPQLGFDPDSV